MNLRQKNFFNKKNAPKRIFLTIFIVVLIISVGIVFGRFVSDKDGMVALVLSKVLVNYTNQNRIAKNISDLQINPLLEQAAELKAKDMIEKGYFAHYSPEGKSPWYWLDKVGYDFAFAGENLAVNFTESEDVNNAWLNSPKHKENIMNGNFTEIGIATVDGMYKGKITTYVVQFFGRPVKKTSENKITQSNSSVVVKTTNTSTSTKPKLSTTASSTVLGESGENILYTAVENNLNIEQSEMNKSFWNHFLNWLFK